MNTRGLGTAARGRDVCAGAQGRSCNRHSGRCAHTRVGAEETVAVGELGLGNNRWEASRKQLCTPGKACGQHLGGSQQPLRDSRRGAS